MDETREVDPEASNSKIIQFWESQSRRYEFAVHTSLATDRKFSNLLVRYLGQSGNLRILDVGTGCGFAAIKAALIGFDVVGIDLSDTMLENARYNAELAGAKVFFEKRDAADTGYPDASFDVVMLYETLYTLAEDGRVLKEAYRVLRPGGRLLIMDGNYFIDQKIESYQHRRELYNRKYGHDEMLVKPEIRNIDYAKLREIAVDLHINKVRRPGWEVWFTRGIGFGEVSIYPRDEVGFEDSSLYGGMNSPLTYVLVAKKPVGDLYQGEKTSEASLPKKAEPSSFNPRIYAALANEDRLKILEFLFMREANVSEIYSFVHLPQNTVSYHLKLLKECGLLECVKNGREVRYRCKDRGIVLYLLDLSRT